MMRSLNFEPREQHDLFKAVLETLELFDQHLSNVPQSKQAERLGSFDYVALDNKKFLLKMHKVRRILRLLRKRRIRFLDVGCGIGTKVFLASHIFTQADGLDVDANYLKIANKLSAFVENSNVLRQDALKFPSYCDYEIVYLYRPLFDIEKQSELEAKIAREAKEHAIIVGPYCNFDLLPKDLRLQQVFSEIYLKSSIKGQARKIRAMLANGSSKKE